ncbi:MAG: class I SAM-dependent methyltransferase [Polyangiaceae bacterium]
MKSKPRTARRSRATKAPGVDRELEVGSLAHYEDPAYYTATYAARIADVAFYVDLAERSGGPVLEYGVGNGRIALPVARHGVEVVGVDHSAPMLGDLRKRLKGEPPEVRKRVTLARGDMRTLRLGRRFPLVVCPFNAALHLYTRADVEAFLARVRAHLTPRGRFVVDLSMPHLVDLARHPRRPFHAPRFRHPTTGGIVKNREYFDYDAARQVLFASMEFEPVDAPDDTWTTPLAHRQFFPQEWEALLHYNGFRVERVEGDFHGGPLVKDSDVMIWHARRR